MRTQTRMHDEILHRSPSVAVYNCNRSTLPLSTSRSVVFGIPCVTASVCEC